MNLHSFFNDSEETMTLAALDLLELKLTDHNINDMIVRLSTVADLVSVHHGYQDKFPNEVPGPPEFRVHAEEVHQADLEAANKDRLKLARRAEKLQECAMSLTLFGQFAIMKAIKYNDTSYIDNIGLDRKVKKVKNAKATFHGPIGAPDPFSVKHGPNSGSVLFKARKVKWAAHYDVYYCLGDPNDEASWTLATTFLNTRNMLLEGLEPGKVYMFRARCLGPDGFGVWSNIIKIMVV